MTIIVNGQEREFKDNTTLLEVLKSLSLEDKVMAAAINMNIIKQNDWKDYCVEDGDKLELLDFVGGG